MSDLQVVPAAATANAVAPAPKPLNAIQSIEQEIVGFFKQKEQAIANVHAIEGAIQAGQHILAKLKAAEAAAVAEGKKLVGEAKPIVEGIVQSVESEAKKVEAAVEADVKKL